MTMLSSSTTNPTGPEPLVLSPKATSHCGLAVRKAAAALVHPGASTTYLSEGRLCNLLSSSSSVNAFTSTSVVSSRRRAVTARLVMFPHPVKSSTRNDGSALTVVSYDNPSTQGGLVHVFPKGRLQYTPPAKFLALKEGESAIDSLLYTINDTDANPDTAKVTVTVHGLNDAPTARKIMGVLEKRVADSKPEKEAPPPPPKK